MYLKRLEVVGLRNLTDARLNPGAGINVFCGANGSGKTSLLEAIYLLGRGRSFRTRLLKATVNHAMDTTTVFGLVADEGRALAGGGQHQTTPIGILRNKTGEFLYKVNGEPVYTASSLAEALPLLLLNSDSFQLLEGGPQHRRRFIDWGVFHVEHTFRQCSRKLRRCLAHRNLLLRRGRIDDAELGAWDAELVKLAGRVTDLRLEYLRQVGPIIERVLAELTDIPCPTFDFRPGWDEGKKLEDVLKADRPRDQLLGYTQHGPHRADMHIRCGANTASAVLSRGQAKILVAAMSLAQGILFQQLTGTRCVYLLDEPSAELDDLHLKKLAQLLSALGGQVFVTDTACASARLVWEEQSGSTPTKMFHVEHGAVSPLVAR